jgi:hypothetical protein
LQAMAIPSPPKFCVIVMSVILCLLCSHPPRPAPGVSGQKSCADTYKLCMGSPLSKLAHGLFFILQPEHNSTELRCV